MMEKPVEMKTFEIERFRLTRRQSKRMLKHVNEGDRGLVKLDFSHLPLYGRFQEMFSLLNSLRRVGVAGAPAEVLMVIGKSGTGKTALVRESLKDFKEAHFLGRGKFEARKYSHGPFATVVAVFAELIASMIDQMGKDGKDYASDVRNALGDGAYQMTKLIPELVDLIGDRPPNNDQQQSTCDYTTFRRLLNLMRCMLRAICSYQKPVILWFDDLHLADVDSLAMIKYLSQDPEARNLLIVGSFEDKNHSAPNKMSTLLWEINQVKPTLIRLGNLTLATVTSVIADVMATDFDIATTLARVVFKRTNGNAFFMIQFLELIQELGLLQFDVTAKLWAWDLKTIKEATSVLKQVETSSDKVHYAVLARLSHLPCASKMVLSAAASLGSSHFDIKLLAWLLKDKNLTIEETSKKRKSNTLEAHSFMSAMVSSLRGFERLGNPENEVCATLVALEKIGLVERLDTDVYRFAHDVIQECAQSLLPDKSKSSRMNWETGQYLSRRLSMRELEDDRLFFTMIDQLNRGSSSISDDKDRTELSSLNLRAAYKARERSSFACAAQYARYGIDCLGETKWEANAAIAMKLLVLAAEAGFANGDSDGCLHATQEAIQSETNLLLKIPAYFLRIKALAHQRQFDVAAKCALEVFEQLGKKFPHKPSEARVAISRVHSKRLLKDGPDELLHDMPAMTDITTVVIMQLLALTTRCLSDPTSKDFVALLNCRMLQLTFKHGLCEESAVAFTAFGKIRAKTLKECDAAYRAGSVGFELQQLVNCPKYDVRVTFEFYAFAHHLKQPIRHSLGPLYQSYLRGLRYGEVEDSLSTASVYCHHYLASGRPLLALSDIMEDFITLAKEYMPCMHLTMVAYGQMAQNLMGKTPNRNALKGSVTDLEGTTRKIKSSNNTVAHRMLLCAQAEHACWFHLYQDADTHLKEIAKLPQDDNFNATFAARRLVFITGLVNVALARTLAKSDFHRDTARKCAKTLFTYTQQGAVDCAGLHSILEAELLSLDEECEAEDATQAYQKGIASAQSSCAHQNVALANELAGRYHWLSNERTTAMLFLRQALIGYTEWNAYAKVKDLVECFPELEDQIGCPFAPTELHSNSGSAADMLGAE